MTSPTAVPAGTITTVAGTGRAESGGDSGPATDAGVNRPYGVAVDHSGNLYIAERAGHRIRKVAADGTVTTLAGTGEAGFSGDGGPATTARLNSPGQLSWHSSGDVYFADTNNHRVRRITPDGTIHTVAGTGQAGYSGDDGPAVEAQFHTPAGVYVDYDRNLFIGEFGGDRVRKVTEGGAIHTVAGTGQAGFSSDDGAAATAQLFNPEGVVRDRDGNVYIADTDNHRVRKVNPIGVITTVAGTGQAGDDPDGESAVKVRLNKPTAVALDNDGNLFIADFGNHRVRRLSPDGSIRTVAGNGVGGYDADGGPAYETRLYFPNALAVDGAGNLYISDRENHRIRKVAEASRVLPPKPAVADLRGLAISPYTAQRGQEFDLGVTVINDGPNTVNGEDVTVVVTLADGLVASPGTDERRLTRTFPGDRIGPISQVWPPRAGALMNAMREVRFRVSAPPTTPPGTYESTVEIQYGGDLNLKNNVFALPVQIVVPEPIADETTLDIRQENVPEAAPGRRAKFNVVLDSATGKPVNPGVIDQRFTAPTGFRFAGHPSYGYYNTLHGVVAGNLDHRIEDAGRTLIVTDNPHVNTTTGDTGPLVYTLGVQALTDARPGVHSDGSASIGKHAPVQLTAKVTGPAQDETPLRYVQESVPEAAPGRATTFNIEIRSLNGQPVNPGTITQRFTAPTGFAFTGGASFGYYHVRPWVTGNLDTRLEDGGRTLIVSSAPHLNTGTTDRTALVYTLAVRAVPDARPGTYSDGRAVIGRLAPVPLSGRIS